MEYTFIFPENYVQPILPSRDEWITALRSGNYLQAKGTLCREGKDNQKAYCCLGLLSEIQGRLKWHELNWTDNNLEPSCLSEDNPLFSILQSPGLFPEKVRVKMNTKEYLYSTLAECNDAGLNFSQIADIIEKVWTNGENSGT